LKKQKAVYSEIKILLDLPYHPNSKTLYVRIREELKAKGVEFNICKLSLANAEITEQELIRMMEGINDEKRDIED
jgi:intracellular sulfur oxidation DsrE/DsrF family protein